MTAQAVDVVLSPLGPGVLNLSQLPDIRRGSTLKVAFHVSAVADPATVTGVDFVLPDYSLTVSAYDWDKTVNADYAYLTLYAEAISPADYELGIEVYVDTREIGYVIPGRVIGV